MSCVGKKPNRVYESNYIMKPLYISLSKVRSVNDYIDFIPYICFNCEMNVVYILYVPYRC